jgi:hypothetical protein
VPFAVLFHPEVLVPDPGILPVLPSLYIYGLLAAKSQDHGLSFGLCQ